MSPHILVVDDCTDIARIIARYLESAGYRTTIAANGLEARAILEQSTFDGIILDIMMPGMSGTELLHDLRRNPATRNLPVILVSARVGTFGTHFRSEADADYCVGKPFTRQQIVQAVRAVLYVKSSVAVATARIPAPPSDAASAAPSIR